MSASVTAIGRAFDGAAADYDRTWGLNPVGLLFRQVVQERLAALFAPGSRVLDLGCGTGEDATFLAARGVEVGAVDASGAMIERAQTKARERGVAASVRFERGALEELGAFEPVWDGAYSNFGALNCADLAAVGHRLRGLLRAGAPVLFCLMGRAPLPAVVERAFRGRGARRADGDVNVGGRPVAVRYPSLSDIREALGPAFRWTRTSALGVCVPGPGHARWVEAHPQTFGTLAMVERVLRAAPVLRGLGDHVVLEGVRS
jgi:SAM-dependent methyltransferase